MALPRSVALLGYGGLVPFVALAGWVLAGLPRAETALEALLAYGAVILAFVGALHWGFAMGLPGFSQRARAWHFTWSTVPALMAWVTLMLEAAPASLLLVAGFVAHFLQDLRLDRRQALPAWYLPMRLRLTTIACLCLLAGVWS